MFRGAMSRRPSVRFDHVMQTEDVSERSEEDSEPEELSWWMK